MDGELRALKDVPPLGRFHRTARLMTGRLEVGGPVWVKTGVTLEGRGALNDVEACHENGSYICGHSAYDQVWYIGQAGAVPDLSNAKRSRSEMEEIAHRGEKVQHRGPYATGERAWFWMRYQTGIYSGSVIEGRVREAHPPREVRGPGIPLYSPHEWLYDIEDYSVDGMPSKVSTFRASEGDLFPLHPKAERVTGEG